MKLVGWCHIHHVSLCVAPFLCLFHWLSGHSVNVVFVGNLDMYRELDQGEMSHRYTRCHNQTQLLFYFLDSCTFSNSSLLSEWHNAGIIVKKINAKPLLRKSRPTQITEWRKCIWTFASNGVGRKDWRWWCGLTPSFLSPYFCTHAVPAFTFLTKLVITHDSCPYMRIGPQRLLVIIIMMIS